MERFFADAISWLRCPLRDLKRFDCAFAADESPAHGWKPNIYLPRRDRQAFITRAPSERLPRARPPSAGCVLKLRRKGAMPTWSPNSRVAIQPSTGRSIAW